MNWGYFGGQAGLAGGVAVRAANHVTFNGGVAAGVGAGPGGCYERENCARDCTANASALQRLAKDGALRVVDARRSLIPDRR